MAQELAMHAGVSYPTVHRFEAGERVSLETRSKIIAALTDAGAMFTAGKGHVGVSVPE